MFAHGVVWDQSYLEIDVDPSRRKFHCKKSCELIQPNRKLEVLVPERHILKLKLHCLDLDVHQHSKTRLHFQLHLSRDMNISDVANVNMRRGDVQARYVEILKNELNVFIFVFHP